MERKNYKFLILIPLITYLFFALIYIHVPGINSDEILFGNAALGLVNNSTHIYIKAGDFPILLMPYIGALKSYLYYPIFKLFGVSVLSIRLPMILLSTVTIFIFYRVMLISTKSVFISFFAAMFLATHASFIAYTRADQGPVAINMFFRAMTIYLFLKFISEKNPKHLIWLPVVMFLGVFNKLNFIWTLNAFIVGMVVFYKDIINIFNQGTRREKFSILFYPALTVVTSIGYYLYLSSKMTMLKSYFPQEISIRFITERLQSIHELMNQNFEGMVFLSYMYENPYSYVKLNYFPLLPSITLQRLTEWNFDISLVLIFVALCINIYLFFKEKSGKGKHAFFFTVIFLVKIAQIILVTNATAGWHLFSTYPIFIFALFTSITFLIKNRYIQTGLFGLLIIGNINDYSFNLSSFEHSRPVNVWSAKINDLISYTQKTDTKFYQLTWGTDDQLISFTQQKDKFFKAYEYGDHMFSDEDAFANTPEARKYMFENYIKDKYKEGSYIVSWQKNIWFKNYHIFEQALKENGLTYEITRNFYDKDAIIYSILKVKEKTIHGK